MSKKNEVKEEKKDMKKIIVGSILGIILIVLAIFCLTNKNIGIANSEEAKKSAEIMDKFYKYMESKKAKVIYYGSDTCSYCSLQTPIMKQLKKDYELDYLYINSNKLTKEDSEKILEILDSDGSTPTISVVKNDNVVDTNVGYLDGKQMVEFLIKNKVLKKTATYKPEADLTIIDYSKYEEIIKKEGKQIITIGQTTCSHCIAVKPVLSHIAGEYDITINYLNLTDMESDEQTKLTESLKEIGYDNADNFGTPLTIIVSDGKLEKAIEGENPPSYFVRAFRKSGIIED